MEFQKKSKGKPRIILAAGGTGGHLFPACQIMEELSYRNIQSMIMGVIDKAPELAEKIKRPFISVSGGPSPLRHGAAIVKGAMQAFSFLKEHPADHILSLGGYGALPVLLAAKWLKVPYSILQLDYIPSRVNLLFGKKAVRRFCYFQQTEAKWQLPCETVCPLPLSKQEISSAKDTLLVCGGSQGALMLNEQVISILPIIKTMIPGLKIVHTTGWREDLHKIRQAYEKAEIVAQVEPFIGDMAPIYAKSLFAICRAGSGLFHELVQYNVPAVLIPHIDQRTHQQEQALLFELLGAGKSLSPHAPIDALHESVAHLLSNYDYHQEKLGFYKAQLRSRISLVDALLKVL